MRFTHVVVSACLIFAAGCGTEQADVPTELVAASEAEHTTSTTEADESEPPTTTTSAPSTEQLTSDDVEVIEPEWLPGAELYYQLGPAHTIDLTSVQPRLLTPRAIADLAIMSEPTATDELHPTATMAIDATDTPYLLVPCATLDEQLTTSVSRTLTQPEDFRYVIIQHIETFETTEAALRHAEIKELYHLRSTQLNECEENDNYLIDAQVVEGDTDQFPTDDTQIRFVYSIPLGPADTDDGAFQRDILAAIHDDPAGQYDFYTRWEGLIIVDGNTVTTTQLTEACGARKRARRC